MGLARRLGFAACLFSACGAPGCGGGIGGQGAGPLGYPSGQPEVSGQGLRKLGVEAPADPTIPVARLVPARLSEARLWGTEPGGGHLAIVADVRVIARPDGTLLAASDRLTATPSSVVEVPERLGSGFLFAAGKHLWGASSWLGATRAVAVTSAAIERIFVGLDRVYLRLAGGSLAALDPRSGEPLGLGPMPAAPSLTSLVALDGWREAAVADLRGVLVTEDAGNSWRPVSLPIDVSEVFSLAGAFGVAGRDGARHAQTWRVTPDLRAEPIVEPTRAPPGLGDDEVGGPFGVRALVAAVEDGWPIGDGEALLARNGALARIRLSDGGVVELVRDAFPLNPARCHPFSLATPSEPGAFGFTCGEPRGQTRIYAWAAKLSRLVELRRFSEPRQVNGFGNGSLAVRGSCDAFAGPLPRSGEQVWCVMSAAGRWSERLAPAEGAHLVVLSDGRTALLYAPVSGDLSTAKLRVVGDTGETSRALSLNAAPRALSQALRLGVWMDGFEERRPGWLGGWVDLAGAVLGIEIALDGRVRLGEYTRDAGGPVVAGRWGFGWSASRRGFETIDGGMSWAKGISLPNALAEPPGGQERSCGPVGCAAAGWLRVGWGAEPGKVVPDPAPLPSPRTQSAWPLRLRCEPMGRSLLTSGSVSPPQRESAAESSDHVEITVEAAAGPGGLPRSVPLARAWATGPRDADWALGGQWEIRWVWPWSGRPEARTTAAAHAPWPNADAARAAMDASWAVMRTTQGAAIRWTVFTGDDPEHALLVMRHVTGSTETQILVLETGRPPVWVRAPVTLVDPIDAATRVGGRWFVATSDRSHAPASAAVWAIDGAVAHELARVPRFGSEPQSRLILARRSDGRALALAVEGQPDASAGAAMWVVGIDPDGGDLSEPIGLFPLDGRDGGIPACSGDEPGWVFDWPYPASVEVQVGERWAPTLASVTARLRVSSERACLEGILGATDREAVRGPEALSRSAGRGALSRSPHERTIPVTVYSAKTHFHLRCSPQ